MMNDDEQTCKAERENARKSENSPRVVSTHDLFAGEREICIEHGGETYRLRITRRNKLILQK